MPAFMRQPPDALFRGSIILGCFAFVVGVAGIFYFEAQDAGHEPDRATATIWVHGAGQIHDIEVVVRWSEPGEDGAAPRKRIETGQVGEEPALFLFRRAPEGRPLDLTVSRRGTRAKPEVLHRQIVILTYGQRIYTAVALKPSGPHEPK